VNGGVGFWKGRIFKGWPLMVSNQDPQKSWGSGRGVRVFGKVLVAREVSVTVVKCAVGLEKELIGEKVTTLQEGDQCSSTAWSDLLGGKGRGRARV